MDNVKDSAERYSSYSLLRTMLYGCHRLEISIATSDHVRDGIDLVFSKLLDINALFLDLDRLLDTSALLVSKVIGDFTVCIEVPVVQEARSLIQIQKIFSKEESHPIIIRLLLESQRPDVFGYLDEAFVSFVCQELGRLLFVFALGCVLYCGRISLAFWITEKQQLIREQM